MRWLKWIYSLGLFLAMCSALMAGTYQYLDHLSIPYNINLFGCGTASCTAMVLQDSAGLEKFTATNPGAVLSTPNAVDGWNPTEGNTADAAYSSGSGSIVAVLKGIFTRLSTPITITPSVSPQNITIAASPLQITFPASPVSVGLSATPLNVTLAASPLGVTIAGPTPLNVTIASTPQNMTLATGVNITQIAGNNIASPSGYGTAPVGSVQGVNAFITNNVNVTPPTPLNVTVGGIVSPQNVTIASTPLNVTFPASPISVGIAGPTPLNVTMGSSPVTVNIGQYQGTTAASPTSYGIAPTGSVQGVNAFVTNSPTVVLSGSPVSVGLATGSSPLNVTLSATPLNVTIAGPTPLAVTLPSTPVEVAISTVSSPVNVTGNFSATVSSPLGVIPFNGASPQNVTLAASPVSVAISTVSSPVNVTGSFSVAAASVQSTNSVQIQSYPIASPTTYGVAPVGSVGAVNSFITNSPTVVLSGSPVSVGIASGSSPLNVTMAALPGTPISVVQTQSPQNISLVALPGSPISVELPTPNYVSLSMVPSTLGIIAWTPTAAINITNTTVALGPSTQAIGVHQLNKIVCDNQSASWGYFEAYDATGVGAVVLTGTTKPNILLPLAPGLLNGFVNGQPGDAFYKGIIFAVVATPFGSGALGTNIACSFSYN